MKEDTHKHFIIRRGTAKVQQKINKSGKCLFLTWRMRVLCERMPASQMSIRCWAGGAVVLSFLCADSGPGARFSELLGPARTRRCCFSLPETKVGRGSGGREGREEIPSPPYIHLTRLLRIIILTYCKGARVFGCDISSRTALVSLFFRKRQP